MDEGGGRSVGEAVPGSPQVRAVSDFRRAHQGLLGRMEERQTLADLLHRARAGHGGVVVLRGEAGIGKSVLLDDLAARAPDWCICRAAGVESEMELPYAGLQQLCGPIIDRLTVLPSV